MVGQPVDAEFFQDDKLIGMVGFPYHTWLKFSKLVQAGMEAQARNATPDVDLLRVNIVGSMVNKPAVVPPSAIVGGVRRVSLAAADPVLPGIDPAEDQLTEALAYAKEGND